MAMPLDIVPSVCPHDCPSTCALEVERMDARTIGRVRGARDNSYTAGVICAKVARYAERQHHPDRLSQPLRRIGDKGVGRAALRRSRGTTRSTTSREAISPRGAALRQRDGMALLLCRHDGPRAARRHSTGCVTRMRYSGQDATICTRLVRHRLGRRHRRQARRRCARDPRERPGRGVGRQPGQHPDQCHALYRAGAA